MAFRGKKYTANAKLVDKAKFYTIEEAVELAKKTSTTKFDAAIDIAIKLNLDTTKAEQQLRGTIALPHYYGKQIRIVAITDTITDAKAKVLDEIKAKLRPEFINRIDEIIIFNELTKTDIKDIVKTQLSELTNRLIDQEYLINFDKKIIDWVASQAYDPVFGARPIKRFIQKNIENVLANEIMANNLKKNKKYELGLETKTKKVSIYLTGS